MWSGSCSPDAAEWRERSGGGSVEVGRGGRRQLAHVRRRVWNEVDRESGAADHVRVQRSLCGSRLVAQRVRHHGLTSCRVDVEVLE